MTSLIEKVENAIQRAYVESDEEDWSDEARAAIQVVLREQIEWWQGFRSKPGAMPWAIDEKVDSVKRFAKHHNIDLT